MNQSNIANAVDYMGQVIVMATSTSANLWFSKCFRQTFAVLNGNISRLSVRVFNSPNIELWFLVKQHFRLHIQTKMFAHVNVTTPTLHLVTIDVSCKSKTLPNLLT